MTEIEMFDALAYAGIAQQTEVTAATVAVYFDQLRHYQAKEVNTAIRHWVSRCSDPFRRLPTVTEIKYLINRKKPRIDPEVRMVMQLKILVGKSRQAGKSQDEIDDLIVNFENRFRERRLINEPS